MQQIKCYQLHVWVRPKTRENKTKKFSTDKDNSYFVEILDESSGEGWKIKPCNSLKFRQHFAENLNEAYFMIREVAAEAY